MFLPYQKNMVNGIDPCLLQIAQVSHDAWGCFDTSPNVSTFPAPWEASPLVVESQWVRNWGRSPCTVKLSTKHRGEKKEHMATKGKNGWGIQKKATNSKNNNEFDTSMPNLRKHGNSQHLEVPMNRNTSSWQNDTLILLDPLNPLKWHQKTTENDSNLGTAVNTSKTHQTRVT